MTKEETRITYQGIIELTLVLITVSGLFMWNRSESNSDRRATQAHLEAIQLEIKDFHGRLCTIEERRK